MKTAIVLKHVEFEGPSRIAPLLVERGYQLDVRALYLGDPVPSHLGNDESLDRHGRPDGRVRSRAPRAAFPEARGRAAAQLRRARPTRARSVPRVRNCSRTLRAHASGRCTTATHGNTRWAGARSVFITKPATKCCADCRSRVRCCTGTVTLSNCRQARGIWRRATLCPNQAFRLGRQFGLQFHCEVTHEDVEAWLAADDGFVERANGETALPRFVAIPRNTSTPNTSSEIACCAISWTR